MNNIFDDRLTMGFWDKVSMEPNSGCWIWIGTTTGTGIKSRNGTNLEYGQFTRPNAKKTGGAKMQLAHRAAYKALIGPIPKGLQIDHLCTVTFCVNPNHLEPVTNLENQRRARPTHCKNGHEYTPENTVFYPSARGRRCKTCSAVWGRRAYLKKIGLCDG